MKKKAAVATLVTGAVISAVAAADTVVAPPPPSAVEMGKSEILSIPMDRVDLAPEKYQPRPFYPESVEYQQKKDFAAVNQHWLNLVIVSREKGGRFTLWDGRHRFEASKANEWKTIDARVFDTFDPDKGLMVGLMGNTQAMRMSKTEIAAAIVVYLGTNKKATVPEVAASMNVTPNTVRNYISLNNLIADAQKLVANGKIKAASAYALAQLPAEIQPDWLEQAQSSGTGKFIKAAQEYTRKLRADPTPATRRRSKEAASQVSQAEKPLGMTELEAMLEEARKADPEVVGHINDAYQAGMIDMALIALGRRPLAPESREAKYKAKPATSV